MVDYTIRKFNGDELLTVPEGSANSQTLLTLPGRGVTNYGEMIAEDFIRLLENFAGTSRPDEVHPDKIFLNGQLWYDTGKNVLNVYNKETTLNAIAEWIPVNKILASSSVDIVGDYDGQLLWHSTSKLVYGWDATTSQWKLIGPVDISAIEDALSDLSDRVIEVETDVTNTGSGLTTLQNRVTAAEGDISSLNGRMDSAEGEIDGQQSAITSLQGRTTTLEQNQNNSTTQVDTLEDQMGDVETAVGDHEGRLDTLESWRSGTVDPLVNDGILGAVKLWYQDPDWMVFWRNPVFVDSDSFRINNGDYRDYFEVGRTVRAHLGGSNYRYGVITSTSFGSGHTTVNANWDGNLTSDIAQVAMQLSTDSEGEAQEIPSGTRMLFYNTVAPAGWTHVTSVNDAALRVVSGNGGATGGTMDFSAAFKSRTLSVTGDTSSEATETTAHTGTTGATTAPTANHSHGGVITDNVVSGMTNPGVVGATVGTSGVYYVDQGTEESPSEYYVDVYQIGSTDPSGSGSDSHVHSMTHFHLVNAHSHGVNINANADFAVRYADVIICQKN